LPTGYLVDLHETVEEGMALLNVHYGWVKSRVYYGPRSDPTRWRLVFDGGDRLAKPLGSSGGVVYVAYYNGGGLGRILAVPPGGGPREVVGEDRYPLEHGVVAPSAVYASYLVDASSRIRVYKLDGWLEAEVKPVEPSNVKGLAVGGGRVVALVESFTRPPSIYQVDPRSGFRLLHGFEESLDLRVSEGWTRSSDGTPIHYFVARSGGAPRWAIVYAYGGFGIPLKPLYLGYIKPLLDRGVAFILANLRGGGEYGEEWHRAGMREGRLRVIEDYKSVLREARRMGFKVVGWGTSNGGLLVAATLTQDPCQLDAAVIGYPLTDMLRYHKLYIGRLWIPEYGDPDDPRDREYLLRYSPYHNVDPEAPYPPVLVYTGLHDDRVHPAHALKFTARLEEARAPVYLRVETASGHMGSSPEVKLREVADVASFIVKVMEGAVRRRHPGKCQVEARL